MRRQAFVALLAWSIASCPLAAYAQPTGKAARVGYLTTGALESSDTLAMFDAFRHGLRELGYVEGQNILIEMRPADGKTDRFPTLAGELVRLGVDVIVATNSLAARAAQRATSTIPIVVPVMGDPVGDGLVASFARPGGNVTGLAFLGPQLLPKRLDLLKEALPNASRVAALWHPGAYGESTMSEMIRETEATARRIGVDLRLVAVQNPDGLEQAFSTIAAERPDALIVYPSPMLFTERRRIVRLAEMHGLPCMAMGREFAELGGLIAYGASLGELHRRAAAYVHKVLSGSKPADLPVEQATRFELVINLKTARALGLEIPSTLLARADEVIE
jgi:putative ABC transport system substrate-binding protein